MLCNVMMYEQIMHESCTGNVQVLYCKRGVTVGQSSDALKAENSVGNFEEFFKGAVSRENVGRG